VVYHADQGEEGGGYDVAIKVFKRIEDSRGRGDYVDGDPRFRDGKFQNASSKDQLEMWAEKEYRNLLRANRAGVPVPSALIQKENVVFMRFLGEDGWAVPQLKDLQIRKGSDKWTALYSQIMVAVRR
jgi:RIO kinase 1